MKARFVNLTYIRNGRFVEIDKSGARHMNMLGKKKDGTVVYFKRETRVILILAAQGAKKISINIYPLLRKLLINSGKNVTHKMIDKLRSNLYDVQFEVDSNHNPIDLENKLIIALEKGTI